MIEGFGVDTGPNQPANPQGPPPQYTRQYTPYVNLTAAPVSDLLCSSDGFMGARKLSLINGNTGSFSVTPLGSDDGVNWFQVRYRVIATLAAGIAAPVEAVGAYNVAANAGATLLLDDYFEWFKFPMSAVTPPILANALLVLVPIA